MTDAKKATEALTRIKHLLKVGRLTYDDAKFFAEEPLAALNKYTAARAKAAGLSARKITFTSFMR